MSFYSVRQISDQPPPVRVVDRDLVWTFELALRYWPAPRRDKRSDSDDEVLLDAARDLAEIRLSRAKAGDLEDGLALLEHAAELHEVLADRFKAKREQLLKVSETRQTPAAPVAPLPFIEFPFVGRAIGDWAAKVLASGWDFCGDHTSDDPNAVKDFLEWAVEANPRRASEDLSAARVELLEGILSDYKRAYIRRRRAERNVA